MFDRIWFSIASSIARKVKQAQSYSGKVNKLQRGHSWQAPAFAVLFCLTSLVPVLNGVAQESNVLLRPGIDDMQPANGEAARGFDRVDGAEPDITGNGGARRIDFQTPLTSGADNTVAASGVYQPRNLTTPQRSPNSGLTTGSVLNSRSNTNPRAPKLLPQATVGTPTETGQIVSRANVAASEVEPGTSVVDATPFAATGIRLGVFDLFPTLEQSIGYTSNADSVENGKAAGFSETTAGLRLQSNWSRHDLQIELGSIYQRFFNDESEALPQANADATLRLDLRHDYAFTLRGGYDFTTESASSSNLVVGGGASVVDRPGVHGLTTSAEFAKTAGKLRYSLRGSLARTIYEDATLSDGNKLYQGDRDNVLASATVRVAYQASPAISPFIEGSIGRRIYNIKIDSNGNQRDSRLYSLRGGVDLDFGDKLKGQLSAGYTQEDFKDANINTLGALTFDGSLTWSPVQLTTVTAAVSTSLSPSANINDNGSVNYDARLGVSRQVRSNLMLDANLTASLQDYDTTGRRDITLGVNAGYNYWFNRFVAATGRVSYEKVDSTNAGSSYDVGTVRFGLKFQR